MLKRSKMYWCKLVHKRTTWPIHGHYLCLECGAEFPVLWEAEERYPIKPRVKAGKTVRLPRSAYEASGTLQ